MWKLAKTDDPELVRVLSMLNSTGWMIKYFMFDFIILLFRSNKCKTEAMEKYRVMARRSFSIMMITFAIGVILTMTGLYP